MFKQVHELLIEAGMDAEEAYDYNKERTPHMRISRVGYPIVSTLLEDFVFSKLPVVPDVRVKTEREINSSKVKRLMATGSGYLFEQIVADILRQNKELEVRNQYFVSYGESLRLNGSCDMVAFNHGNSTMTVVECKSLKYGTLKEVKSQALENDSSSGYTSQLAVYIEALKQSFPNWTVNGCWMVWAKASASLFKVPFTLDSELIAKEALEKVRLYSLFASLYEAKNYEACLDMLNLLTLPTKPPVYAYYANSCPAHYSPWCNMLIDEIGEPYDEAKEHLKLMLEYSFTKDLTLAQNLLDLV